MHFNELELNLTKEQVDILLNLLEKAKTIMEQEKDVVISDDGKYKLQEKIVELYFEHHNFNVGTVRYLLEDKNYEKIIVTNEKYVERCLRVSKNISKEFLNSEFLRPEFCENFAIVHASKYGLVDKVRELINHPKVDPTVKGNKALIKAIQYDTNLDIVELLINDHRVISLEKSSGKYFSYALAEAVDKNFLSLIYLFLNHPDLDPTAKDAIIFKRIFSKSMTNKGYFSITCLSSILKNIINHPKFQYTEECYKHIKKYLLSKNINKTFTIEIIKILLSDDNFDPTFNDNILLMEWVEFDHPESLKFLLDHPKIDPSYGNYYVLRRAICSEKLKSLKVLLDHSKVEISNTFSDSHNIVLYSPVHHKNLGVLKILEKHHKINKKLFLERILNLSIHHGNSLHVSYILTKDILNINCDDNFLHAMKRCLKRRADHILEKIINSNLFFSHRILLSLLDYAIKHNNTPTVTILRNRMSIDCPSEEIEFTNKMYTVEEFDQLTTE